MMHLRELTLTEVDRLPKTEDALQMDQETFRALYERTARPLWSFLWRKTSDAQAADDLLQETFYRFLRSRNTFESDAHRRNYLFRIAANLANDHYSCAGPEHLFLSRVDEQEIPSGQPDVAELNQKRTDLNRAMSKISSRQRDALWLAYVEGSSHEEIANVLGLKTASIKLLLFRARHKLAKLLRSETGGGLQ